MVMVGVTLPVTCTQAHIVFISSICFYLVVADWLRPSVQRALELPLQQPVATYIFTLSHH
jgi:hypothetical protein